MMKANMRPFLRRLGICAWLLWFAISALAVAAALYTGVNEHSQTYSHRSYSDDPMVPVETIASYRKNTLPAEQREFLIRAVTRLEVNLPPGDEVDVPRTFSERFEFTGAVLSGSAVFAFFLMMFQYLALGYPNPIALFKEPKQSPPS